MTVVTFTGNADPHSGTRSLSFRSGGLVMPINTYADLTSQEIAQAQALGAVFAAGQAGGAVPATPNPGTTLQGGVAYIQSSKPTPPAGQLAVWFDSSTPSTGIFKVDDQGTATALSAGSGGGTILPFQATHAYAAGEAMTNAGQTYTRITSGTSRATFDATEQALWALLPASAPIVLGPAPSGDVSGATDGAAINAAQAALSTAGGGILQLQKGTYWGQVKPYTNVTVQGVGNWATVIKQPVNTTTPLFKRGATGDESMWWFRDLVFDGNRTNQTVDVTNALVYIGDRTVDLGLYPPLITAAPHITGGDLFGMERVLIRNVRGDGIAGDGQNADCRLHKCMVFNCSGNNLSGQWLDCEFVDLHLGAAGKSNIYARMGSCRATNLKCFAAGMTDTTTAAIDLRDISNANNINGEIQEASGDGFRIAGTATVAVANQIDLQIACRKDAVVLDGGSQNDIRFSVGAYTDASGTIYTARNLIRRAAGVTGNKIRGRIYAYDAFSSDYVSGGTAGNYIAFNNEEGAQTISYGAAVNIDPLLGGTANIGPLTGPVLIGIAEPTSGTTPKLPYEGQKLTVTLTQDSTGGRAVSWTPIFRGVEAIPTTANSRSTVSFVHDGSAFVQSGKVTTVTDAVPTIGAGITKVPHVQAAWFASDITGLVDGDPLVSCPDRSGNGRTLLGITGSGYSPPIYKTNIVNTNKPVMRFTGAHLAQVASSLRAWRLSMSLLVKMSAATAKGMMALVGDASSGYAIGVGNADMDTTGANLVGLLSNVGFVAGGGSYGGVGTFIVTFQIDTTNAQVTSTIRKNGTQTRQQTNAAGTFAAAFTTLGGVHNGGAYPRYFTGDICAVVIGNRVWNAAELAVVEGILAAEGGLTIP